MDDGVLLLAAPLSGCSVTLRKVPDPVFARGLVGSGIALDPEDGKVVAPLAGRVTALFPTYHALALRSPDGLEVLIHIGIESMNLKGLFDAHVQLDQQVRLGEHLLSFDPAELRRRAFSPLCLMVVTALPPGMHLEAAPPGLPLRAGIDPALIVRRGRRQTVALAGRIRGLTGEPGQK